MVVIFVDSVYLPVGTMFHQINVNPIHGAIADLNVRSENSAPFADFFADYWHPKTLSNGLSEKVYTGVSMRFAPVFF